MITFLDAATIGNTDLSPLQEFGQVALHPTSTHAQALDRVAETEILITNKVVIDKEIINSAPNLKLILAAATGLNHIDIETAKKKNIPVHNVENYSTPSVAQHVFTLILNLSTATHIYNQEQTLWPKSEIFTRLDHPTFDLQNKTLGIVGLGAIGSKVAAIAKSFDMNAVALESHTPSEKTKSDVRRLDWNTLLEQSDILTLHCPLTEKTKHLINEKSLSRMKPTAFLINTGRGPLINETHLLQALQNKTIAGAGLDVLAEEPPPMDHPLITANLPNLIITPHTAWSTAEARQRLLDGLIENIQNHHANRAN